MSGKKDDNSEIEKVIQTDEGLSKAFYDDVTSNTSETSGDIPDFTSGNSEPSDSDSKDTDTPD